MQQPDPSEIGQEVTDPTPAGRDAIQRVQPEASTQQTGREAMKRVQPEASTQQRGRDESRPYEHIPNGLRKDAHYVRFDWFAVGVVIIIAAVFAIAAHLNTQPATSLVPAAVLSATGCGLLVTALRKLRTFKGAGVFEAALGGLFLALFQFISALSFPGVLQALSADPLSQPGFFTTWGLVAIFSIVFSMAGAALGHLAFAPLRPLPVRKSARSEPSDNELEAEDEMENAPESVEDTDQARDDESQDSEDAFVDEQLPQLAQPAQRAEQTLPLRFSLLERAARRFGAEPGTGIWTDDVCNAIASTIVLEAIGGPAITLVHEISSRFAQAPHGTYMKRELTADLLAHVAAHKPEALPNGPSTHTTISLVVTNRQMSIAQLQRLAVQVHGVLARQAGISRAGAGGCRPLPATSPVAPPGGPRGSPRCAPPCAPPARVRPRRCPRRHDAPARGTPRAP